MKLINHKYVRGTAVASLLVFMAACSSTPIAPTRALNAAQDAITVAEQGDARRYSGAELDEARQRLVKAEQAVSGERMVEAERFAQEALITAELALARTDAAKARKINEEMGKGADALIEEMQRTGEQQ